MELEEGVNRKNQKCNIRENIPDSGEENHCTSIETMPWNRRVPDYLTRTALENEEKRHYGVECHIRPYNKMEGPIDYTPFGRYKNS